MIYRLEVNFYDVALVLKITVNLSTSEYAYL